MSLNRRNQQHRSCARPNALHVAVGFGVGVAALTKPGARAQECQFLVDGSDKANSQNTANEAEAAGRRLS